MFTVNDAHCTDQLETAIKQHIKQWTNGYFIKMDLQEIAYKSATATRVSNFVVENVCVCVCVCVFWHLKAPRSGSAFSHTLSNRLNALSMF